MKKRLLLAAKLVVTAVILAVVVSKIDFRGALDALASIAPIAAAGAIAVVLAQALVLAVRLVRVAAVYGARLDLAGAFKVTLEGMFFSHAFVSFLGADALRIWRVRQAGLRLTDATAAITLDRLIGLAVTHLFLLAGLPWLLMTATSPSARFAYLVLAVAVTAAFAVVLALGVLRGRGGLLHRLHTRMLPGRLLAAAIEVATVGRHVVTDGTRLVPVWLLSVAASIGNMAIFAVILLGMGVSPSLALGCAVLTPAVLEVAMIPVSVAGLGLREGAAVVAFGAIGLPADQALAASLAFGLSFLAVGMIGGALWFFDRRRANPVAASPAAEAADGS